MCEKNKRVNRWLATVFGERATPEFEVNTRTIALLEQLAAVSELRCEEASLVAEDHARKAAEYGGESAHLQEVLFQGVGLQPGSDSKLTSDLLSVLEGTAETLKVKDTSLGSLVPAINQLTNDLAEAEKTDRRLGRELSAVRRKMADMMILQKKLQE